MEASLCQQRNLKEERRAIRDAMTEVDMNQYHSIVRGYDDFVPDFRATTPEQERAKLSLGSRSTRRRSNDDGESVRATPWILSWMQMCLMLPAWLGAESVLEQPIDSRNLNKLREIHK